MCVAGYRPKHVPVLNLTVHGGGIRTPAGDVRRPDEVPLQQRVRVRSQQRQNILRLSREENRCHQIPLDPTGLL
eukprot:gene20172-biopygen10094